MTRKLPVFLCTCAAGIFAANVNAQPFTVTLEVIPGQTITGGATVLVEGFIQNDGATFLMRGYQLDLPCILPGKPGSSGTAMNPPPASPVTIGNASAAASGAVPWAFSATGLNDGATGCEAPNTCVGAGAGCAGGLKPISQAACRWGGSPGAGEPPYCLPGGGARRYLGTIRYTISQCAAGTFNIPYEVMNMPCQNVDLTRLVDANNNCVSVNFIAGAITIPTGSCCDQSNLCGCDNVNQACCEAGAACVGFNRWNAGRRCTDPAPCACTNNAQCDDGQFCNGAETCNLATGACDPGTPPMCPGSTDCRNGVCDPTLMPGDAGNLAGRCIVSNKPDGLACTTNGEVGGPPCNNPDTCLGGVCNENFAVISTPCGDQTSGECDNTDHCDGAGNCDPRNKTGPCTDDGNACTDDACVGGVCTHTCDTNNGCNDGINCTENDRCVNDALGCRCTGDDVTPSCVDADVCTIDGCDEGTGLCFNIAIGDIPCIIDSDCPPPSTGCGGAFCICVSQPDCLLLPHKVGTGVTENNCHDEGDKVVVDFAVTAASECIAGASMRIVYDPSCLVFQSADPGQIPWTNEIFEQVDAVNGVIFYAVGAQVGGGAQKCSSAAGVMATFSFTKVGVCNWCDLCLTSVNPQHTRLVTQYGNEVLCADLGCSKMIHDRTDINANCPGPEINVNSDCLRTTAVVTWDPLTFVDKCSGIMDHECTCTASNGLDCEYLADSGGTFPQGTYSFECSALDETCKQEAQCKWTVTVSDEQTLDVHLQLSPKVDNDEFTRCICFELISSCSPLVMEEHCETITFGGPFNFPGQADDSVKIPKGKYVCVQARDIEHSLRSTHFPLTCDGHHYSVTFKGDPFFGGNWLIQGNLNGDPLIDILDFGMFLGRLNNNATPGKGKACDDPEPIDKQHGNADFNGDGIVNVEDYTYIQINFLANDKDDCCHNGSAGADEVGRTEISVKDLREMGLPELAIADLNNDGLVNTDDMAAFVQGARPKAGKVNGTVGRPSTIRGSR